MQSRHLVSLLVAFICVFNGLHAQTNPFTKVFDADSLIGFHEETALQTGLDEGLSGDRLKMFLDRQRRLFVIQKYGLDQQPVLVPAGYGGSAGSNYQLTKHLGGGGSTFNSPCVNEGFESGSLTGWTAHSDYNPYSCSLVIPTGTVAFPSSSLQLVTLPYTDSYASFTVPASPFTGSTAVKMGDQFVNAGEMVGISQTFSVTSNNFLYEFAYLAVMATQHTCCQQPYMRVLIIDQGGNPLSCPLFTFAPPATSGPNCSSSGIAWTPTASIGGFVVVRNPTWQRYSIDLTQYIGGTPITILVIVSDCSLTGHFAYSYFDSNCGQLGFTLNNSTFFPAPTTTILNVPAFCGQSATITAPSAMGTYTWNGPSGSGITNYTNQTITTGVPGTYTISMAPAGVCAPIVRMLNITFPPPTTIAATPGTICSTGTSTNSTLSITGAASYTWNTGQNGSTISVSPTTTTIYTVAMQTGTCAGTNTVQVNVDATPTIVISNPVGTVCVNQTITLSANGASTYVWNPGGLTGATVVVTPSASTVYTAIGTSSAGCPATATTNVGVGTPPSMIAINLTGSVCAGNPISAIASGPGVVSYSWLPTSPVVTGNFVSLTPLVTTNYTVVGAAGNCTASTTMSVLVDPGPSMTLASTPSVSCPGDNVIITATAPTATGFTWTPVSSSSSTVAVTPTVTTTYSVRGINASNCISSYTYNQVVAPVPILTITPTTPTVCSGSNIVLTASGGSTYTWNPGSTLSASLSVSPTITTGYTVTASNGTCSVNGSKTIAVTPIPTVSASGVQTVCAGSSTTLTATGAGSYTWLPGGSTGSLLVVAPTINTTYTVIGANVDCTSQAVISVTVFALPNVTSSASPSAICIGSCPTITVTSGGALSYSTSPSPALCPTVTTTYTTVGTDAQGCVNTATFNVVVNPLPTLSITPSSNTLCSGSAVTMTASGASTYTWSPLATIGSVATDVPSSTASYTVSGTSAAGCINSTSIIITVIATPTVTASASPTLVCAGSPAVLSATGATSYNWNPGSILTNPANVTPVVTTTYVVSGTTSGCTGTAAVVVNVNPLPTITPSATPSSICAGANSTLSATGATGYTWNPGGMTGASTVVNPPASTVFSVTGVDAAGCSSTATIAITVNPIPILNITVPGNTVCSGSALSMTATGATNYTWMPGALSGAVVSVTPAINTVYTVTGASAAGCNSQTTISIFVNPTPTLVAAAAPVSVCPGAASTLTVSGAASYTWLPMGTTGSVAVVNPSSTTVYSVVGQTGICSTTSVVTVFVNPVPAIVASSTPTSICPGGVALLSVTGAATGYTWQPINITGASTTVNPVSSTVYTVTAINAQSCTSTATVALTVFPAASVSVSPTNTTICSGDVISLSASGASTYTWMPGSLVGAVQSLTPATTTNYTVIASSVNGCTASAVSQVSVSSTPTVAVAYGSGTVCAGNCATVTATGASNYTWFGTVASGSTAVICPSVTSTYTVRGAIGSCNSSTTFVLVIDNGPALSPAATPTSICIGGTSTLQAFNATGYTWTPGPSNSSTFAVFPTTTTNYTVTGVDAAGCSATATVNVVVNPAPSISVNPITSTICPGGSTFVTASGGTTYVWSPGGSTGAVLLANPSTTTIYTVTGTSSLGCPGTNTAMVVVAPAPNLTLSANPTSVCPGVSSTLTALGATNYTWSTTATTSTISVAPISTQLYTVTGVLGICSSTAGITVTVNPVPVVTASASSATICAGNSTTLSASGAGVTGFLWMPGSIPTATTSVAPSSNTIYTVTGTNASGCTNTAVVSIAVNALPTVTAAATPTAICIGNSAVLSAGGASSYSWLPGPGTGQSFTVSPTSTQIYTVTGTSSLLCSSNATVRVIVNPLPTVSASATPTAVCPGGTTTLTATGGTAYTWSGGLGSGSPITTTLNVPTIYSVTATDANGCSNVASVTVSINPIPTIGASVSPSPVCAGNTASLSASGAASYTWNPGLLSGAAVTISPSSSQVYTVNGTSAAGCAGAQTVNVVVNPNPTVSIAASSPSLCSGTSVTLTANTNGTTYTWTPSGGSASTAVVSPVSNTTYTVVTALNGCTAQATQLMTVFTTPTVNVSASAFTICLNSITTLSAIGATSYTWNPGPLTGANVTVSPSSTTVYTVTGSSSGCSSSNTLAIAVNTLPIVSATTAVNPVCSGNSATLVAGGAVNYTWQPGGSTGSTYSVVAAGTTNYTVTGQDAAGCSNTAAITLTVNTTPTVGVTLLSNSVCVGFPATLTANGATSYTWLPSGNLSNVETVTVTSTSVYTVTGNSSGCSSSTTIQLVAIPLPTLTASANPSILCIGDITTFTVGGASTYTWLPGLSNASSFTLSPTASIVYTVAGIGANGCPNFATVSVSVLPQPTVTAVSSSTAVCTGSTAVLTATGATTYTWLPGPLSGSSVSVNPTSATVYTVVGQTGSCTNSVTLSVAVNALPVITASLTNTTSICAGGNASVTATGGLSYTWMPSGTVGGTVVVNPTVATVYTVTGQDNNGCQNIASVNVTVNPLPVIVPVSTPTGVCQGGIVTLSVSGGNNYTWTPVGGNATTFTDNITVSTTYSVSGDDANGCIGTATVTAFVFPTPTVGASASNATSCAGSNVTLTASGATNYTWLPGGATGSVLVDTPTATTVYTVTGDNGGICFGSATVSVLVNPLPANVTATSNGTVTCTAPTVTLTGASTDTNVSFSWSGPSGYTATGAVVNVTVWGTFTLSVTNASTGCTATQTVIVPTDNSIPSITATASGSITCAAPSVTLIAANSTGTPGYAWSGPSSFSSAAASVTVSTPGIYTVVVTDLSSTCSSTAVVNVLTHTRVATSLSISPATCSAGVSNNNGTILALVFASTDKFDMTGGTSYTGTATYTNAAPVPTSGILTNNLANPTTTVAYTVRMFDAEGCFNDTTLILSPVDCVPKVLGIAKAVTSPTVNSDLTYDAVYSIVVKNTDATPLTNVSLTDHLDQTFPSPITFTVVGTPSISSGSQLVVNSAFDGISNANLLVASGSTLNSGAADTVKFRLRIKTIGVFGVFKNSAVGLALTNNSVTVRDSSQAGLVTDPDSDGNPTNNNVPTTLTLVPQAYLGVTKVGSYTEQADNTFDVTYTITVYNAGNDTLKRVAIEDVINGQVIHSPASYSIKNAPVADGMLTANSAYDGNTNYQLLDSLNSILAPGQSSHVMFTIHVIPDTVTVLVNSARGVAGNFHLSDLSNNGTDPDTDHDMIFNEAIDNVPTIIVLPTTSVTSTPTLYVPGGFSPNGDGINDVFEIKGLDQNGQATITIFNRWGNRIYYHSNYNNTWNGYPNIAGTLGKDKLPQGTYYYILELKGTTNKTITGFIVLEY